MLYARSGDPGVRPTLVRPRGRRGVEVKSLAVAESPANELLLHRAVTPSLPAIQHRQQETPVCTDFQAL